MTLFRFRRIQFQEEGEKGMGLFREGRRLVADRSVFLFQRCWFRQFSVQQFLFFGFWVQIFFGEFFVRFQWGVEEIFLWIFSFSQVGVFFLRFQVGVRIGFWCEWGLWVVEEGEAWCFNVSFYLRGSKGRGIYIVKCYSIKG